MATRLYNQKYYQKNREKLLAYAHKNYPIYRERNKIVKAAYYKLNKERLCEEHKLYMVAYEARIRKTVFEHYGNKCACPKCPEPSPSFLTVDHMTKEGKLRDKGLTGMHLYRKLINLGFPDDVRLLCFNCNCTRNHRGKNGVCPHML